MSSNIKFYTQGLCKYCGKKLERGEMLEHLAECKKRNSKIYDTKRKEEGFFDILITSKTNKNYWMIIEVSEKIMLKELDTFLREIWLGNDDCLSTFEIENVKYNYIPGGNVLFCEPEQSMYHAVRNILPIGKTFDYIYDENYPTEVELKVIRHRIGLRHEEEDLVLLSRNISPKIMCDECKKNEADWVSSVNYFLDREKFWCDKCKEKILLDIEIDNFEYIENILPVCNSPRMGINDYEGSDFYSNEFKSDSVKEDKPKKIKKDTLKKFKTAQVDAYSIIEGWEDKNTLSNEIRGKRNLATLEQWRELYNVAEKIKSFKVWEYICEFEVIALKKKDKEPIFYSILGEDKKEYGVDVYEGYSDFKTFLIDYYQEGLNISKNYVKSLKSNLSCRWGNIEELSKEQIDTIKKLGFRYKGRKKWLHFMSFEQGYIPDNLDEDEVVRMTKYLKDLVIILEKFIGKFMSNVDIDFNELFCVEYIEEKEEWKLYNEKIPLEFYESSNQKVEYKNKLNELKKNPKIELILDVDIVPLKMVVNDKKYKKAIIPCMYGIVDLKSGNLISNKISKPGENVEELLAKEVIRFVDEIGIPRGIRTSNIIISSKLSYICDELDIELKLKRSSNVGKKFGEYIMYKKEIENKILN